MQPKLNIDIDLAKERLGWEPKIRLGEGLKRTIGYFKGRYSNFRRFDEFRKRNGTIKHSDGFTRLDAGIIKKEPSDQYPVKAVLEMEK